MVGARFFLQSRGKIAIMIAVKQRGDDVGTELFGVNTWGATGLEGMARLLLACVLGGVIGYERQARHKSAGLRTNILVCLGACLVMLLSQEMYANVEGRTNADPARLAAQVVSGIGFLGAGAIMKEGPTVKGLTTAACLWVVAGVGLAVGAGYYAESIFTTVIVFVTLGLMGRIDHWLSEDKYLSISIEVYEGAGQVRRFLALFDVMEIEVRGIRMVTSDSAARKSDAPIHIELELEGSGPIDRAAVVDALMQMKSVKSVAIL